MTINLEKALIKANKKVMAPEELLLVKEYETNGSLINDDSLKRVGLLEQIKLGKVLFHLMRELYQRREFCRAATEMKMNRQLMDISIIQLESHNERIKKLLKF